MKDGEDAIRRFWRCFDEHRTGLVSPVDEGAMEELAASLEGIDERATFLVGERDDGADLILSAEGHCDVLALLRQVRDRAPQVACWRVLAVYDGDLVVGRRNTALFPEGPDGDVLLRMARAGDDLCVTRAIDFSVVFPDERARASFLDTLRARGLTGRPLDHGREPWDVTVTEDMLPTHASITAFERQLALLAAPFGGRSDGWGCFQRPSGGPVTPSGASPSPAST